MPNITNSITYRTRTRTHTGSGTVTAASSVLAAKAASAAYQSWSYSSGSGSWINASAVSRLGGAMGQKSGNVGVPQQVDTREWVCSWNASQTFSQYQFFIEFSIPSNLTSANLVGTATLTIATNSEDYLITDNSYYVCAPKNSSSNIPSSGYVLNNSDILYSTKANFSGTGTAGQVYTIDITNQLKQCVTTGKGWLLVTKSNDNNFTHSWVRPTSVTLSYTIAYTNCGAPTTITYSPSIVKPDSNLTISWGGATAGTNNPITGYDIYYKIGSAPSTSSYDGKASVDGSASSNVFAISSSTSSQRGQSIYVTIYTKGTVSGYDSDPKTVSNAKINSLPAAPNLDGVSSTRIKSTGSTDIVFTVTAGVDSDTSQTRTLYYATSPSGTKTLFTSPLTQSLSNNATYYFWTYDGLEYSASYTSQSIRKNIPPIIESITMSGTAFTPSVEDRNYVKNINGSASNVTKDSEAILTYNWYLVTANTANGTPGTQQTRFSTATSLSNIDVTASGVTNFNMAYKLRLIVIDDLGEQASADSDNIFCIPTAQTLTIYNNRANSNKSNTNAYHFEDYIRFKYNKVMTGITKELQYANNPNFNNMSTLALTANDYQDVNFDFLTRGQTYYFRIKITCNTINTTIIGDKASLTRALDITPNISPITGAKPYTDSTLTISFTNQPTSWVNAQDVSTSYGDIYSCRLINGNNTQIISISSANNSSGTVNLILDLAAITTTQWKTLLGTSNAPNDTRAITLEINATNGFGKTFTSTNNFNVNFIEGIASIGTLTLKIKMTDNSYENIPTNDRYNLFPTQTLNFNLTGFQCYADQDTVVELRRGGTTGDLLIKWPTIPASAYGAPAANHVVTLTEQNLEYTLPQSLFINEQNIDFYLIYTLANGNSTNTSKKICKLVKLVSNELNATVVTVEEEPANTANVTYQNNFTSTNAAYMVTGQIKCSNSLNGTYNNIGNSFNIPTNTSTAIQSASISSYSDDILYFKLGTTLNITFTQINGKTPAGTSTYYGLSAQAFTLYRVTPTLLYGKNFLVINRSTPRGTSDELLTIQSAGNRKKIYIGDLDASAGILEISNNGLIIDCGSWS